MFYSVAGLRSAWRSEAAFRQECVAVVVLSPVAVWLGQNAVERALLFSSGLLVLIVELLNTAIEFVVEEWKPSFSSRPVTRTFPPEISPPCWR
jgi:diacylglycerol kinase (ATP)